MSERNGKYYTLATRENGKWAPQFGDYDRKVVQQELEDTVGAYHQFKRKDCTIFWTWYKDGQAAIDEQIRRLNNVA